MTTVDRGATLVVVATSLPVTDSAFIAAPAGYRITDQGHLEDDAGVRVYSVDPLGNQFPNMPLDRYSIFIYSPQTMKPYGFDDAGSAGAALQNETQSLVAGRYDIEDSSASTTPVGSVIRIRALRRNSNELLQEFLVLFNDGSLVHVSGGGALDRVARSQQLRAFAHLSASLLAN